MNLKKQKMVLNPPIKMNSCYPNIGIVACAYTMLNIQFYIIMCQIILFEGVWHCAANYTLTTYCLNGLIVEKWISTTRMKLLVYQ